MTPTTKEMVPGADATTCTQEMKAFKAAVRWNSTHNVSTKDEWRFGTSYARHNRLVGLGVTNKHAAIRGMPVLKVDQAKAVSKIILKQKGLLKKSKDVEN